LARLAQRRTSNTSHIEDPMTYFSHTTKTFTSALLGSIVCLACGDAPGVEASSSWEQTSQSDTPTDVSEQSDANDRGQTQSDDPVNETDSPAAESGNSSDPLMIDPADEPAQSYTTEPSEEGEPECAPSVFPQTQNVPTVVERVVTETVEVPVEVEVTPTALLLLDRSLSMREAIEGEDTSRWQAMEDLLFGGEQPLLEGLQEDVKLGMTHFTARRDSDPSDGPGHCVDLSVPVDDIQFETGNFETLLSQQEAADLGYGTPTGEALAAVSASFVDVETEGEKHIVVVTDGEPAHCDDLFDFSGEAAIDAVMEAATTAHELGITVHVIGIGPDVNEEHLREMAEAGGGLYRSALTSESMQTAFEEVLREVDIVMVEETTERIVEDTVIEEQRSCSFDLEFGELGADAFLEGGAVRLSGEALLLDADDGWTLNQADELELLGQACESYLEAEAAPQLEIELACPNRYAGFAK
jgi:hypothetical protein